MSARCRSNYSRRPSPTATSAPAGSAPSIRPRGRRRPMLSPIWSRSAPTPSIPAPPMSPSPAPAPAPRSIPTTAPGSPRRLGFAMARRSGRSTRSCSATGRGPASNNVVERKILSQTYTVIRIYSKVSMRFLLEAVVLHNTGAYVLIFLVNSAFNILRIDPAFLQHASYNAEIFILWVTDTRFRAIR